MSDPRFHSLDLDQDEDGWDIASCACGWVGPPCPGSETAAEFYADHVTFTRTKETPR